MDKNAIWKWLILIVLVCWSLVLVTPLHEKIKLGLDLRGGTSYLLEVDTSALEPNALKDARERALEVIRNRIDAMGIAEPIIYPEAGNNRIVVQIPGLKTEDRERALKNLQSAAFLEFRMVHPKNDELISDLFEKGQVAEGYRIVTVDDAGPGMRGGKFWKRDPSKDPAGATEVEVRAKARLFQAPAGYELLLNKEYINKEELFRPYYVNKRRELSGESLKNAGVDYHQFGQPIVNLKFDGKGAKRFAAVTSDYAPGGAKNPDPNGRRYLAIVLDGTLYSAPFIKTAIHGGEAIIEGTFTLKEAQDLAIVLRAGSLPAPVKVVEERTVDPSLGQDSIESGKRAAVIGGIAVMAFMAVYYLLGGMIANLALVLNLILLPLGMVVMAGFFSILDSNNLGGGGISLPTLTLPGIAGILLTIGMAVDANVLIFERMREEQRQGKRFGTVISAGYEKAFSAIFDSNITTILAGVIMFWMGSGPIRGYAVTLAAGVAVSMYTAIVVTRMIFDLLARYTTIPQVKMLQLIKETKINFVGLRYVCYAISAALIIGTMVVFAMKGQKNFGVDFTGGATMTFEFTEKAPVEKVRDALAKAGVREALIQYQKQHLAGAEETAREYLEIKTQFADGKTAVKTITDAFPGFRVLQEDSVGPQVGKELQKKGLTAVLISLIGMIIYISWRFEFGFSVGAVVALIHDVIITVGVFCLLGRQLSVMSIAAILTIIGWSVNDTIVVFDRIRENVKLYRGKPFAEVANLSLNQTLSRTLLTSLTTLISVAALLIFGGGAINDFALVMFVGIIIGTYSSIAVATPIAMLWHPEKKLLAKEKTA